MYDVAIIGSGLGGLECGAMLSREGLSVCVLEKNPRIGGALQTFARHGHNLDTGIHYVGGLGDGQILNQYLRYMGVRDSLDVVRMDVDAFDTVVLNNREYGIGMGYERFAGNLKRHFPAESDSIDRFCAMLQQVGGTMSVDLLRRGVISDGAMPYMERGAAEAIDALVADPALRAVLAGTSLLYAGVRHKTPLYHYAMINHSFIESAWQFVGGSQQLADALANRIRGHGGEIFTNAGVTAIRVQGNRVRGVEINSGSGHCGDSGRSRPDGDFIEARHVISDIHPAATMRLLEKTSTLRKASRSRLESLENSSSVFTVYLIAEPGALPCSGRNHYIHSNPLRPIPDTWNGEYDTARNTPRSVLLTMQASRHDQQFAEVASILCPMRAEIFAPWAHTTPGQRGDDYNELKTRLTEQIIDFTTRRFPHLRGAIAHTVSTSPLSWRDYTASPDGSAYGVVKNHNSPLTTLIPVETRLENLLLTGQNINVHGALGVTVTAAITCSKLLGTEHIAKKIGNA
jgi:phytoene dehydrogenase-like protein